MHSITEPESLAWTGFSQVPQSKVVGEPDWVNSGSMSTEPYLLIKDDLAFNVPFNVKATRCSGRNTISGETLCRDNCQLIGMSLIGLARQVQKNRD